MGSVADRKTTKTLERSYFIRNFLPQPSDNIEEKIDNRKATWIHYFNGHSQVKVH